MLESDASAFVQGEAETGSSASSPFFARKPQQTVTLRLDADGNLAPLSDRMRSRLQEIAGREDWTKATGLPKPPSGETAATAQIPTIVDKQFAENALDAFAMLKRFVWGFTGLSKEAREELLSYSAAQKDLVAPPLAMVINKHSGEWMRKYKEEVQLIALMSVIEITQAQTCSAKLIEERKQKALDSRRGRPVSVMPEREAETTIRETPVTDRCNVPGCNEPAVPGMNFCRIHRRAVAEA